MAQEINKKIVEINPVRKRTSIGRSFLSRPVNKHKKRKLKIIGSIITFFFFNIFSVKLINSNQHIKEIIVNKNSQERLFINKQFKTIAINITDVIILFFNSLFI